MILRGGVFAKFHNHMADLIPCEPEAARADLDKMRTTELLCRWVNWADRFVVPRPRRVVTWEGFLRHGSPQSHEGAVHSLAKKIEAGDDLTPFLSEQIGRFGYVPTKPKNNKRRGVEWKDKDYALNAFETHHLHLSSKHAQPLLYVSFSSTDAFLVMVGDHNSFDDGTLAQAVAASRVGTLHEFKGILGSGKPRTMPEQTDFSGTGFRPSTRLVSTP